MNVRIMINEETEDRITDMTKEQILKDKEFIHFVFDENWNPYNVSVETLRSFYIEYLS